VTLSGVGNYQSDLMREPCTQPVTLREKFDLSKEPVRRGSSWCHNEAFRKERNSGGDSEKGKELGRGNGMF